MLKEYQTVSEIYGPLMLVESVDQAKFGHIVDIEIADGSVRHGQILQVEKDKVLVQVFEVFPFFRLSFFDKGYKSTGVKAEGFIER